MDVLLLNLAELVTEEGENKNYIVKQVAVPPMGLLYMGQVLTEAGYSVKIYDQLVTGTSNAKLMNIIKKLDPKIIGFSVLYNNYWTTVDLLKRIKAWNPNVITVAGNYFATFLHDQMMSEINFDYCVRGEGEQVILNLVDHILKGKKNLNEIKGIAYRENGKIKSTPMPGHIQDLDELPIPYRKLIDFNYKFQKKSTAILTSRGCPFNCKFCNFSAVMGKKWRYRSVKNVIEEIKLLSDQGYKDILFVDDNFTLNKKRISRLSSEIRRNGLDHITYSGDCRVDNTSFDLMRTLVAMNCKKIMFGIESGSQRILDYYQKNITPDMTRQAVKAAKKARMESIFGSFVIGAPDETFEEARSTVVFANKLGLSFLVFQILDTIPNTPIYNELVEKGLYTPREDDWKKTLLVPEICPTTVSLKSLNMLVDEGLIQFFTRKLMIKMVLDSLNKDFYIESIIHSMRNLQRGGF